MIPSDFIAVHRLVAARFHECLMELFSTDEADKWLLQLRHERAGNLGFLLTVDNLAAFCVAMQQCIDVAISHSDYPNAEMMINTVALNLETNKPTRGGISISSIWADDPNVQFNFYLDQNDSRSCVTLIYFLEDAMRLHDRFAIAYNKRECF